MSRNDALADHRPMRNLPLSGEPASGRPHRRGAPIFVIQRHGSFRLHFDFHLEVDGMLVSWAVPKGPSTDPRNRRTNDELRHT
jgi:bifunctional non-homologous end joining protein LigD